MAADMPRSDMQDVAGEGRNVHYVEKGKAKADEEGGRSGGRKKSQPMRPVAPRAGLEFGTWPARLMEQQLIYICSTGGYAGTGRLRREIDQRRRAHAGPTERCLSCAGLAAHV